MRTLILLTLLAGGCAHELRSRNPDLWVELQSEHFTLRTDVPEEDARRAIRDLETIRNALLEAGWHARTTSPARIGVVALASEDELREFLQERLEGIAGTDHFGDTLVLVAGGGNLLRSEVVKHEVTHALMREFLVTSPRWVNEGVACFLETLQIDPGKGVAVRGAEPRDRRDWILWRRELRARRGKFGPINWSLEVMGTTPGWNADDGYEFETLSWALVHWLVDTDEKKFTSFLSGLARGESMWQAFGNAFPGLAEPQIAAGMNGFFAAQAMEKARVPFTAWSGAETLRKMPRGEVHALRAELLSFFAAGAGKKAQLATELALAKSADPGNPLALALSDARADELHLAIDRHPEDWRSWELWFDAHETEMPAIRKAAELAPENAGVLSRLAIAEQAEGRSGKALELALRAVAISPGAFQLHSLATVYEKNGRCAEALAQEERAASALPDRVSPAVSAALRTRLSDISSGCGKASAQARTVEAEPVLKTCRQPLYVAVSSAKDISVQFTIRENGSVAAVAVEGAHDRKESGMLRQFVESCSFEPVVVEGKPRRVQLKLTLDAFLQ